VALRLHNSGHHTIESCYTSQYEQHWGAVVGLPLGDPSMKTPAAVMYNILGEDEVKVFFFFLNLTSKMNMLPIFFCLSHVIGFAFERDFIPKMMA
jgi:phosphoribosylaminoimidazole carboxylase (NCAIR synthetase)